MEQHLPNGTVLQGESHRYTIVKTLGQGSFGITYLAHPQMAGSLGTINVKVAIKEFFMRDINTREGSTVTGGSSRDGLFDRYRHKFQREAQNLSRMQHPGIVRVIEAFDANDTSYIAMEYLGGGNLDSLINLRRRLPEEEALRYIQRIGEALSFMHTHQMLHLDLKPSNVMLNDIGDPVIIDFGLSKQYDENGIPESSTTVGGGTPGYAPIEQASYREGEGFPVTMDIYALGATLYKMLIGQRPPEADRILNDGFPDDAFNGISQSTIDIVRKAMAIRKADRYQSADDFLAALGHPVAEPTQAATEPDEATVMEDPTPVEKPMDTPKPVEKPTKLPEEKPTTTATTTTPPPTTQKPKKKHTALKWILIGLLIAIFATGTTIAIVSYFDQLADDLSEVYDDIIDDDYTEDYTDYYFDDSDW